MSKARKLGIKTGFTPNSQADRLHCCKAYSRGRKAERQYQKNAAAKKDIEKMANALKSALINTNWAELPRHLAIYAIEGDSPAYRKEKAIYEANRSL